MLLERLSRSDDEFLKTANDARLFVGLFSSVEGFFFELYKKREKKNIKPSFAPLKKLSQKL